MGGGEFSGIEGSVAVGRDLVVSCDSVGRGGFSKIARSAAGIMSLGRCDTLVGGEFSGMEGGRGIRSWDAIIGTMSSLLKNFIVILSIY